MQVYISWRGDFFLQFEAQGALIWLISELISLTESKNLLMFLLFTKYEKAAQIKKTQI